MPAKAGTQNAFECFIKKYLEQHSKNSLTIKILKDMKTVKKEPLIFSGFLLPVLLILSFAVAGFAQETKSSLQDQIALVSEFDVNGLKVIVKRRPNMATVSGGLFIRGGARNLTTQTAGIENFALEAATEGSKKYPREVLRRETASTGGGIGAGSNNDFSALSLASTRKDFDRYGTFLRMSCLTRPLRRRMSSAFAHGF